MHDAGFLLHDEPVSLHDAASLFHAAGVSLHDDGDLLHDPFVPPCAEASDPPTDFCTGTRRGIQEKRRKIVDVIGTILRRTAERRDQRRPFTLLLGSSVNASLSAFGGGGIDVLRRARSAANAGLEGRGSRDRRSGQGLAPRGPQSRCPGSAFEPRADACEATLDTTNTTLS